MVLNKDKHFLVLIFGLVSIDLIVLEVSDGRIEVVVVGVIEVRMLVSFL